ncbi:MAG: bifunctional oligoribonuclease/PAP phosphatase NrnA [Candidatus Omnitrophica bacterium]|nr:bifunctional oligoribonuclease/PAP phosphatase NrnA [Candidatus Omnitrophota bacterium]
MGLQKIVDVLKTKNNFLVTSHINLEGDALGAELAFAHLVRALGKRACIVNDDVVPYGYDFLTGAEEISKVKQLKNINFDCFAILDCSDLRRCGEVAHILVNRAIPIMNIDHHVSNENFGEVNWVNEHASSCSEMIYTLFKTLRIPFTKEVALALYVGIMTDTGSFRYSNTTHYTHEAAAELLTFGLKVPEIYKNIYGNIKFQDAMLLARILPTIKRQFSGRVAVFEIKQGLLKNKRIDFDLSEHILSFGRGIKGVEAVLLFKENALVKNEIRVNFRSQGKIDVNKIARFFGGGGHKTASGATIKGALSSVRRKVLAKIKESL